MTSSIHVSSYGSCAFQCAVAETQGPRDSYEDVHAVALSQQTAELWLLDGHHGAAAARLGASGLTKELGPAIKGEKLPSREHISQSFRAVDNQLRQALKASPGDAKAGSTVVGLLASQQSNGSYSAQLINCGDSRGLVIEGPDAHKSPEHGATRVHRHSCPVIIESIDHKPSHPYEKARILAAGGRVLHHGDCGDRPARIDGHLAVSRGLGDFRYKSDRKRPASRQKVTCTPDIYELSDLQPGTLVLLACDGLWDVMTTKDVSALVSSMISGKASFNLADIAQSLVRTSLEKNTRDNVTVLLAQMAEPSLKERDCESAQCNMS